MTTWPQTALTRCSRRRVAGGGLTHNDFINAVMCGDEEMAEALFTRFDRRPVPFNLAYPVRVSEWGGDFSMAERVARGHTRSENVDPIRIAGHLNLARVLVGQGKWRAAAVELDVGADVDVGQARMSRAVLATLPFLSIPRDYQASTMEELQRWEPPVPEPGSPPERAYDRHARLYVMGLLSSKLGDVTAALEYADAIEELADVAATAVPGDLATTVRASLAGRGAVPRTFSAPSSP
jgi:hypothetical protein